MKHFLYVSRSFDGFDADDVIERIVGKNRAGSGAGMGTRDMDFAVDKMSDAEVDALKAKIQAELGEEVELDVLYDEWDGDADEPSYSYEAQ